MGGLSKKGGRTSQEGWEDLARRVGGLQGWEDLARRVGGLQG